jgi:hypothetical protein
MAFGWSRFRQALASAAGGDVRRQTQAGWDAFLEWQGQETRRDDISILGAEIGAPLQA